MDTTGDSLSVIIVSSQNNPNYKKYKDYVQANIESLKKNKINFYDQSSETDANDNSDFFMFVYSPSMQLIDTINSFNPDTVNNFIDKYGNKPNQKGGKSSSSFKDKYNKYKTKYRLLKNVIMTFD